MVVKLRVKARFHDDYILFDVGDELHIVDEERARRMLRRHERRFLERLGEPPAPEPKPKPKPKKRPTVKNTMAKPSMVT